MTCVSAQVSWPIHVSSMFFFFFPSKKKRRLISYHFQTFLWAKTIQRVLRFERNRCIASGSSWTVTLWRWNIFCSPCCNQMWARWTWAIISSQRPARCWFAWARSIFFECGDLNKRLQKKTGRHCYIAIRDCILDHFRRLELNLMSQTEWCWTRIWPASSFLAFAWASAGLIGIHFSFPWSREAWPHWLWTMTCLSVGDARTPNDLLPKRLGKCQYAEGISLWLLSRRQSFISIVVSNINHRNPELFQKVGIQEEEIEITLKSPVVLFCLKYVGCLILDLTNWFLHVPSNHLLWPVKWLRNTWSPWEFLGSCLFEFSKSTQRSRTVATCIPRVK